MRVNLANDGVWRGSVERFATVGERTYTLENYEAALKDLAAGNFMGKLVFRLWQLEARATRRCCSYSCGAD